MRVFFVVSLFLFVFCCIIQRELSEALSHEIKFREQSDTPPRGWNSYDSFSWTISEEEFLQNAEVLANRLLSHGYQYVVVDYLWYRRKVPGANADSLGFDVIDEWGRMIPDPDRWPSSRGGKGFTEVAKKVHDMGLKFGIHVMSGISTQAVNANTPILDTTTGTAFTAGGREWRASDIGREDRLCPWMSHGFMGVEAKLEAANAFLRSLYQQYSDWGVDLVKHDCVFGTDFDLDEITVVSEVLSKLDRPLLYSLSPGTSVTPALAKQVSALANMYRVTGDDWDSWADVASHFDVSRDMAAAGLIGATGLHGKSWPDLDMLPLGWLTDPASNEGPHRKSNLNLDEQRTQMTLWSMAKSPLMFGGDLRKLDTSTLAILANPTLLEINAFSLNNMEFPYITGQDEQHEDSQCQRGLTKRFKSLNGMTKIDTHVLDLSSCEDYKTKGWVSEVVDRGFERICWKHYLGSKYSQPFCLYKRKPLLTLDDEIQYKHQYQGKLRLFASNSSELCLDASPKQKLTSRELKANLFSPCRQHSKQMWELRNGTLVNSYSGLCATMKTVKANANSGGIRSWIATGRKGEIYVSLFNLSPQGMEMSVKKSDLAKALPGRNLNSCIYNEVWTKASAIVNEVISLNVPSHGCALIVIGCKLS